MNEASAWRVLSMEQRLCKFKKENTVTAPVLRHPLVDNRHSCVVEEKVAAEDAQPENYDFEDPLGVTVDDDQTRILDIDELREIGDTTRNRAFMLDNTLESKKVERLTIDIDLLDFTPWREKRAEILSTFRPKSQSFNSVEALEQKIHAFEKVTLGSPKGIPSHVVTANIAETRQKLAVAWESNQRIESMRLVTELSKLLVDTSDTSVFPYHWVLATDVLDFFGRLVFDRLLAKSNEERKRMGHTPLPSNFTSDHVPPMTKETAKHWFLKVSEVKDLVPRFYVETTLIACMRFLDSPTMRANLERLASMCSSFAHEVAAAYARAYICKMSIFIDSVDRCPHWRVLHDWFQVNGVSRNVDESPAEPQVKRRLMAPAIEWVVQCVAYGANTIGDLAPLWEYSSQTDKVAFLVPAFLRALPSKYLAMYAKEAVELAVLNDGDEEAVIWLGRRFATAPPVEDVRNYVKKIAWRRICAVKSVTPFLECCVEWTRFTARNFPVADLEKVLDLIWGRINANDVEIRKERQNMDCVVSLLSAVVESKGEKDLVQVMTNENFMQIIGFIGEDVERCVKCAQILLSTLVRNFKRSSLNNFQMFHLIIEQSKNLCGSASDADDDEMRIFESLVSSAVVLPNLARDLKQGLQFVTDARAELGLRQTVLLQILAVIADFTFHCYRSLPEGAKKADVLRVCITNFAVTIPAIHEPLERLRLSLQAVQLSLLVNFLPQMDLSTRRCLETLETLSESVGCQQFAVFATKFLAVLQFVPDLPERKKFLYYFDKLFKIVSKSHDTWSVENTATSLAEIYVSCLRYLCVAVQPESQLLPQFASIAGNAILYGGDEQYLDAAQQRIDVVMERVLALASDFPIVALHVLENVSCLFEVNEQVGGVLRGLLKRSVGLPKMARRVASLLDDLRLQSAQNQTVEQVLCELSLL